MKNSNKLFSYCFFIGAILGGAVCKFFLLRNDIELSGFCAYFIEKIVTSNIDFIDYIVYLVLFRGKFFLFFYILAKIKYSKFCCSCIFAGLGLNLGIGFVAFTEKYEMYGILIFLTSILPQWIVYMSFFKRIALNEQKSMKEWLMQFIYVAVAIVWEGKMSLEILKLIWHFYKK